MARRTKYYFNNETLSYEKIERSAMYRLRQTFFYSFTIVSLAVVFAIVLFYVVPSPSEKATRNENQQLKFQYEILSNEMDVMLDVMLDIQQRDDNLYRILFQAEPFPKEKRELSDGSDYKYSDYANLNSSKILINTSKKADRLAKMIYAQTESFDEIVYLSEINEKKLQYIPAIQPILNKDLTRIASGFGYRTDPVYRTKRMHQGMDFTAPTGTDIYATGNGVVIASEWKQGYGNTVVLDHGFGYKTLYAHLYESYVEKGDVVKRGDVIAAVGNTGKSTGPHLHYEVRVRNTPVDPMNYYFMDLSPEEYDRMIQIASNAGRVMD